MAQLAELRKQAKSAGFPASQIRGATADEIQAMLDGGSDNGAEQPVKKRKPAKKKVSSTRKKATTTARKKSAPARSRKSGTAKRQTTRKRGVAQVTHMHESNSRGRQVVSKNGIEYTTYYEPAGTRNVLDDVDWSATDGWNPRDGSVPDLIVKSLKRFNGKREKVFNHFLPKIGELVPKTTRAGRKMNKAEHEDALRYRISSTAWRFAIQTGQHEKAEGRVKYGTGGTGEGKFKPKRATPRKATGSSRSPRKASTARRATRKRATAQRPAQSRTRKSGTTRRRSTTTRKR